MKRKITMILIAALLMLQVPSACAAGLATAVGVSIGVVNQDPDPAIAGDIVAVAKLREANNLMVELVPGYPFELMPGENAAQRVGTLQGYQGQYDNNMKILKYQLRVDKDATAGTYELKARYYEEGSNSSFTQKGLYLEVTSRESAEVIHIDKTALLPGKQTSLKFTINNVGNAPLRDLSFNWVNDDKIILPVGSDNTRYIKYIEVGGSVELEYQVIADSNTNPGLYQLNLYLTYTDPVNNSQKKTSTIAGVYVGGGTDFDVAFSESSSGATSFSVANIGSNPAFSVSVIVPEQKGWSISGSNSVIIGNLNKGDYTVASFNLLPAASDMNPQNSSAASAMGFQNRSGARQFNSTQARPNQGLMNSTPETLLVQIVYTDTMGERSIIEKQVRMGAQSNAGMNATAFQGRMSTAQQGSALSDYKWYLAGIAAIAAGLIARRRYMSRKMPLPDLKIKDLDAGKKK